MTKLISVDSKSYDLAVHFLTDEPNIIEDDRLDLAGAIQTAVENWFAMREHAVTVAAEGDEDDLETCPVYWTETDRDGHDLPGAEVRGPFTTADEAGRDARAWIVSAVTGSNSAPA